MAKLTPTVALISALLILIVNASFAYRTIITTVEIDESNPGEEEGSRAQQCRQEIERKDLSSCSRYIGQSGSGRSLNVLELVGDDRKEKQELQKCCNQVKKVSDQCQCEAIRNLLVKETTKGEVNTQEYYKMMERAGKIPASCGLRQKCPPGTNPSQGRCQQQIQSQQNLRQCQEYIRQQVSGQGSSRRDSDQYSQKLRGCCDHLEQMETQCRCQGLSQAIEQQQSQGHLQGQDVFEAFRIAKDLPSACGVSPSQCQFRSVY